MDAYRSVTRDVTAEDRRTAWYLQLGMTVVLAAALVAVAFVLGAGDAEWPVPAALVISSFAALVFARVPAHRRRRGR
jgi:peptidoglycan/LPS O-acetylase OafA/YrhL